MCVGEAEKEWMKLPHVGISSSNPIAVSHCANNLFPSLCCVISCGQTTTQPGLLALMLVIAHKISTRANCVYVIASVRFFFFKQARPPLQENVENLITDGRCWL